MPRRPTPPAGSRHHHGWDPDDEPTPPPTDVEELVRRLWPFRKAQDQLLELQTRIAVLEKNPETTHSHRIIVDRLTTDVREVTEHIVDIKGTSGDNGKIGALRADLGKLEARLDKAEARRWTIVTALIGMILTAGTLAVAGGRWVGKVENRVDQIEHRLDRRIDKNMEKP